MKNILIALDYDPTAQIIAETGYELGKALEAQVTLLHVISNEVYYSTRVYSPIMGFTGFTTDETVESNQIKNLKEAAYSYLEKTRNHLGDNNIRTMVKEGDFADNIIETGKLLNADIIVLGTHSRRWLEKIVMGSVTEKVMKNSKIPLLIIPTRNDEVD
ncbi:MAG: universal stress protein [Omnitrophica WOR_2 bacterium]|jgi:nucleotide-binding universal stress UspA family protein